MKYFEWNIPYLKNHPLKATGVVLFLAGRLLYSLLFLYGFVHKIQRKWMWTDIMTNHFLKRFHELPAGSFQANYLEFFAIPFAMPIAWIVTIGELIIGLCLLVGLATRINAAFGLFLLLNFAAGGYYNMTIPPLVTFSILLMVFPSGHWLGLDNLMHRKYPESLWFK
jgi:thiosulfate dehydrogenase [quinone] large subunit